MEGGDFGVMASVDTRVVEMQFKRDDFLKGTDQTLEALQRLEDSLTGSGGIQQSLAGLNKAFSGFGAFATGAIMRIGSSAISAGGDLMKNIMDPLFSGGKKRSLNLEQADFQLRGIANNAKDIADPLAEVDLIMKNVGDAVDGTAYGLDVAALAASQFMASGMRGGTEMANALRGISGVAAMAGASYEDISDVFTKVAGQGRLMGDDLNRLATRGINAAATLSEALGMTEADVRKLVTEGGVSFDMFAAAMNDAFGDHATKANETYAGSLSNIRAALARISAPFFAIEQTKLRDIFNALRPAVNHLQKSMGPLYDRYQQMAAIPMAKTFERWGAALTEIDWRPFITGATQFIVIGSTIKGVIASWIKPIGEAFAIVFASAPSGSWMEKLIDFLNQLNRDIGGLKATEEQADALRETFVKVFEAVKAFADGFATAMDYVGKAFGFVWDILKIGFEWLEKAFEFVKPYVLEFVDYIMAQIPKIQEFFQTFRDEVERTGSVWTTLKNYGTDFIAKYITPLKDRLFELKDALLAGNFTVFGEKLAELFEPLTGVKTFFTELWNGIGKTFEGPFSRLKTSISKGLAWIRDAFTSLMDALGGFAEWIADVLGDSGNAISTKFNEMVEGITTDQVIAFLDTVTELVKIILIYKSFQSVIGTFDSIKGFFTELGGAVGDFRKRLEEADKGNTFLKVAIGLGILAAALWLLSKVDPQRLLYSVAAIAALAVVMGALVYALSKMDTKSLVGVGGGLFLLALALGGLATALILLGLVPFPILVQGLATVLILLAALAAMVAVMGSFGEKAALGGLGLLLVAAALSLLIIPVKMFGEMDLASLIQGGTAVIVLMFALAGAAMMIGTVSGQVFKGALAVLAMAVALKLLVDPIQELGAMDLASLAKSVLALVVMLAALTIAAMAAQGSALGAAALAALAASMWLLADALAKLAAIPFLALAGALVALAVALAIMVVAGLAATPALAGLLGLAALVIAFGLAMLFTGIALALGADAILKLSAAFPQLLGQLIILGTLTGTLVQVGAALAIFAIGLAAFGAAAIVAGVGAMLMGAGLALMGLGMMSLKAAGQEGIDLLVELAKEAAKLVLYAVPLGVVSAALAALGIAIAAVGAGLIVLGLGLLTVAVGLAILTVNSLMAALAILTISALSPAAIDKLLRWGEVAEPLVNASTALGLLSSALTTFVSAVSGVTFMAQAAKDAIEQLGIQIQNTTTSVSTNVSILQIAMSVLESSTSNAASSVPGNATTIGIAFKDLADAISGSVPPLEGIIKSFIDILKREMSTGATAADKDSQKIADAFKDLADAIKKAEKPIKDATEKIFKSIKDAMKDGQKDAEDAIKRYDAIFGTFDDAISKHEGSVKTAANNLVSAAISVLNSQEGSARNAGNRVGSAIASGMANGIRNGTPAITAASRSAARKAEKAALDELGIKSPSRVFFGIGVNTALGFVLGIESKYQAAQAAGSDLGHSAMDSIDDAFESELSIFDNWELSPLITPVVDSSAAIADLRSLAALMGESVSSIQASGVSSLADSATVAQALPTAGDVTNVNFTQNNTSPKSLSNADIYRRTKNLLSMASNQK